MFNLFHAVKGGWRSLLLYTGDSELVVIATYVFTVCPLALLFGSSIEDSVWTRQRFVSV